MASNSIGAVNSEWFEQMAKGSLLYVSKDVDLDNNAIQTKQKSINYDPESGFTQEQSPRRYKDSSMLRLPVIGRIHYVQDIQGIAQITVIFLYWIYGTFSTYLAILWPMYNDGRLPFPVLICKISLFSN